MSLPVKSTYYFLLLFFISQVAYSDQESFDTPQSQEFVIDSNIKNTKSIELIKKALEFQKDQSIGYNFDSSNPLDIIKSAFEKQESYLTDLDIYNKEEDHKKILNDIRKYFTVNQDKSINYNIDGLALLEAIKKSFEDHQNNFVINNNQLENSHNEIQKHILTFICDKPYLNPPKVPTPDDRYIEEDKQKEPESDQDSPESDRKDSELDKIRKEYGCP